jgi:hypothetical protein
MPSKLLAMETPVDAAVPNLLTAEAMITLAMEYMLICKAVGTPTRRIGPSSALSKRIDKIKNKLKSDNPSIYKTLRLLRFIKLCASCVKNKICQKL